MKTYTVTFSRVYEVTQEELKDSIFLNTSKGAEDYAREMMLDNEFEFLDASADSFSAKVTVTEVKETLI